MILNLCNKLFAFLAAIAFGCYYFLTKNIQSASSVAFGCLQIIAVFVLAWVCFLALIWLFYIIVAGTINPKKEYKKFNKFYYFMLNYWYSYILSFFKVKIELNCKENLPCDKRFLLICNHRSNLDNMVINAAFSKSKIAYIAKKELFNAPLVRDYISRALYIKLDRKDIKQSLHAILKAISFIKNDVISIGVFPEGTRSKTGKLLEFNPGCLKIATKTLCPIVVFTIQGTEKVKNNLPFKKTIVKLDLLKVFSPQEYDGKTTVEIADTIRNLMQQNLIQQNLEEQK